MGRNPNHLNEKQVVVLKWVKAGCPDGVYPTGYEHRITARALAGRGLVKIAGRGATWQAEITESGSAWEQPDVPGSDTSDVDDLVRHVVDAGGRLELPADRPTGVYAGLIDRSLNSALRPRGKKLALVYADSSTKRTAFVVLAEHFDDLVHARPVPIPKRITKPHTTIAAYMEEKDWVYITPEHIPRATALLQALVEEAERRGMEILPPGSLGTEQARVNRVRHVPSVVFRIVLSGRPSSVTIKEISRTGGGQLPPTGGPSKHPLWQYRRTWKFLSTGRLEIACHGILRDERWVKLEETLPEVFRRLEVYQLEADWKEAKEQREQERRNALWEAAMQQARHDYDAEFRIAHFRELSDRWETINRHRAFLAAAQQELTSYTSEERQGVSEQLSLAERWLDGLDPLRNLAGLLVDVPEPKPEDLKPFLAGWSPQGPNGRTY